MGRNQNGQQGIGARASTLQNLLRLLLSSALGLLLAAGLLGGDLLGADIALRDPAWASKAQWGGMVDMLVADIATMRRGAADFPFLRNFDPYEGPSWASGVGLGAHGNNQESSSEAINAWAGLIQCCEITGNAQLRNLGLYLYTTEIEAIHHY